MRTTHKFIIAIAALGAFNLAYYQSVENAFSFLSVVDADGFNAAPDPAGNVADYSNVFSTFNYSPLEPISDEGYKRFFDVKPTGNVLDDTVAVVRKTRELYVHREGKGPYPFLPDAAIEDASSRPVVCGTYARTTAAALDHMGHVSRVIYLNGHITLEVFDFERNKWLYIDPNYGMYLTDPDGSILSMTEFQDRFRSKSPVTIHSLDDSTDDPQFVYEDYAREHGGLRISMPRSTVHVNGFTAFEDGAGYNYRRKSLLYRLKPAHIVHLKDDKSSPYLILGGFGPIIGINMLATLLLGNWVFRRKKTETPRR